MEASGAGLAAGGDGGDAQGQQQGQQQGEGQQPAEGQGLNPDVIQQFQELTDGLTAGQDEMRGELKQFLEAQQVTQQEAPAEPEAPDLSFLQTEADPERAAQQLQQVISQEAQKQAEQLIKAQVGPLSEQVTQMQQQQEADALMAQYPDLGKPEVAKQVLAAATDYATLVGDPALVGNAKFLELTYLAGRAQELGQQQQAGAAAAPGAATLEGAGGASPGGAAQGANPADEIAEKWGGRSNVLSKL